jgi:type IV fimbrial biogenesis protein FimT
MRNNSIKCSGFTLVELMITLAIAGILVGVGIPSFNSTISSSRLTSYANELVTALNLARSEAVKRGVQVTVSRKGSTSAQWESGWNVFVDFNGNEVLDDTNSTPCELNNNGSLKEDCLLRTYDALPGGYTLRTGNSTYKDYAAYSSSGLTTVVVGDTFTLCSGSGAAMPQRTIAINAMGRPRVVEVTGNCP